MILYKVTRFITLTSALSAALDRLLLESSSPEEVPLDGLALYLQRGSAAISTTLSYLFVLIARHPRVEERVLQELDQVLGEGAEPSVAQLEQLVFCSAVVEEVLRLYPPSPLEERHLLRSLSLKRTSEKTWGHPDKEPVSLPPGTTVLLPVWHIHRFALPPGTFSLPFFKFLPLLNFEGPSLISTTRSPSTRTASCPATGRVCLPELFLHLGMAMTVTKTAETMELVHSPCCFSYLCSLAPSGR